MIETLLSLSIMILLVIITLILKPKNEKEISTALFWQYFWIIFAVINPLGLLYSPKSSLPFIVLSFLGFTIGYSYCKGNLSVINPYKLDISNDRHNKFIKKYIIVLFPVFLFLAIKAYILIQNIPIYAYRREVYQNPEMLFGYAALFPLFQLIIEGGLLLVTLSAFHSYIIHSKKSLTVLVFVLSLMFSVIFLGRYPIYRLIIMMIFFTIGFNRNYKLLIKVLLSCLFIGLILVSFSLFRGNGVYGVSEIIVKHVFGYHSFGYHLLEHFFETNESSFLDNTWVGGASLGSFGYFLLKPISLIFSFDSYLQSSDYINQDIFINLGVYEITSSNQMELLANAFYTIFREFYVDFSYLGIIPFVIAGMFSRYCFQRHKLGDIYGSLMLMYIIFIILFLGMRNPLLRHEVIVPALYLVFMIFKTRRNFKYV